MNTKNIVLSAAILGLAFAGSASAQDTATGTLAVTGSIVSSISLTIESAGGSATNLGTAAANTALGNVSKFGPLPASFSRTTTVGDYTLSSNIGVTVTKANSISTAYTLNAQLASLPATGIVWRVNNVELNSAGIVALATGVVWGTNPTYAWAIQIADTVGTATALDNTIMFDAISG